METSPQKCLGVKNRAVEVIAALHDVFFNPNCFVFVGPSKNRQIHSSDFHLVIHAQVLD